MSNTHNFWAVGPKNTFFVLLQSLFQCASSQKNPKNPKIYCIYSSLPKNAKSHFGYLSPLGVKQCLSFVRNQQTPPFLVVQDDEASNT
jgi:hypothetical protein